MNHDPLRGNGIGVAVVGLGFGAEFVPLYQAHPDVVEVAVADPSPERLTEVGERYDVEHRYAGLDEVLADDRWDVVHLLAPVRFHADQTVAALDAGRHVACAVPMATTLADVDRVLEAQRRSGRGYTMMETSVFGREFQHVEALHGAGALGTLTAYRGFHVQDLDGFPWYWRGFPPMHYVTHALSPLLALTGSQVERVTAHGTGRLTADRVGESGNPFPAEVGLFRLRNSDVVADVTMSFFQVARSYVEGFCLYGDRLGVEWPDDNEGPLTVFDLLPLDESAQARGARGRPARRSTVVPRDRVELLPEPLRQFASAMVEAGPDGPRTRPAHHGGSHPFLVHEMVRSVVEGRPSRIDAPTAAAWTAPGICAHESALRGGEPVDVPAY